MHDAIIKIDNLGKKYTLRHSGTQGGYTALRDVAAAKFKRMLQRSKRTNTASSTEEFWALKDISLEIQPGEVVGIIGHNGAGKSTLLKILSRITEPTNGRITLRGRVASLLEVGTGFHPELTGRENVYLNGAMLGMSRLEIQTKFKEIVAFAEVERFLDTPVKHYSSGMYVRLAFAVAAHLEPEILIIDEVLAVGDAEFQKRCLGKLKDVTSSHGRTILFVSHNMTAIKALCHRCLLLDQGRLAYSGPTAEAISRYTERWSRESSSTWKRSSRDPQTSVRLTELNLSLSGQQPSLNLNCIFQYTRDDDHSPLMIAVDITDGLGSTIMQALPYSNPVLPARKGKHELALEIQLPPLIPGSYNVDVWISSHHSTSLDYRRQIATFHVADSPTPGRTFPYDLEHGFVVPHSICTHKGPF